MTGLTLETDLDSERTDRPRGVGRGWSSKPVHVAWGSMPFSLLWLFIGTVSCYDAYLILKYQQSLMVMEMNPIGTWLMQIDGGGTDLFLAAKFQGTLVVLGVLQILYFWNARLGQTIAGCLAVFQAGLLGYLSLALPN